MWGVLAFVGNFIPYVGSLIALVLPVLLAFLELEPLWQPLAVLALLLLVQFVTNNFVEPRLTARAVDLSPLVVLVALAFWGLCWGAVGMVLAVPLTVMLKIIWENIALTRPLARLMAEG
jgi:predicted PurR-regulated permease PerM